MDAFLACETGVRGPAVARRGVVVTAGGRVAAGRVVEAESEARDAVREGGVSMLERDVMPGRFVVGVVVVETEGVRVDLRAAAVLVGVARAAALVTVAGRRTVGVAFFLSSPEVTDDRSGSASEELVFEGWTGRRTKVLAGAGRVAGLLVEVRVVDVEARGVAVADVVLVVVVGGRRAVWAPKVPRRGAAGSLLVAGDEAMADGGWWVVDGRWRTGVWTGLGRRRGAQSPCAARSSLQK